MVQVFGHKSAREGSRMQGKENASGIDPANVSKWLESNIEGAVGPFEFELIAGGRSNLTFQVTSNSGRKLVLRRPPTSLVLKTAHDMGREYKIISALSGSKVPVPKALGFCEDTEVNGAPFYVMDFVEGTIARDPNVALEALTEVARRHASESLVEVLAEIHSVDVDACGLGDLGRKDGYIERQLERWYGQFTKSREATGREVPEMDEVYRFLSARVPEQGPATIVHGDYRLDNTMLDSDGNVVAVLDWELCTLGDPLADLGLLMVYWPEATDKEVAMPLSATSLPGFMSRKEIQELYAAKSGRDISYLDFYVAFGFWKLGCILEGVYSRYALGAMGTGDNSGFEFFGEHVRTLARLAQETSSTL